nr:hypothetical protein [Vibrio parahaemolyticus]
MAQEQSMWGSPTAAMKQLAFEVEKTAAGSIPVLIEAIEQVAVPTAQ